MNKIICENCEEENEYGRELCRKCGNRLYYNTYSDIEGQEDDGVSIYINLSIDEVINKIKNTDLGVSFTIEDKRTINISNEKKVIILVVQKYFYRANNYCSATIIVDNVAKYTRLQIAVAGSGYGLLGIDYGVKEDFYDQINNIFSENEIKGKFKE